MNITLHFVLIFAACVFLVMLILNIGTRVNLLALALLLFFISLLTGCENMPAGLNASVTGGVSGTTKGVDGKDINYDLHSTVNYVKPTPTPRPPAVEAGP